MNDKLQIIPISDYSEILQIYGQESKAIDFYWQVGKIEKTQGWILHLSVVIFQLQELLELVVPELITSNIAFKIIMNQEMAIKMMDGALGYIHLGKMVTIYPENNEAANALAKTLIKLTTAFRSPAIPTDRHLGGAVYTRFGSFKPIEVNTGSGMPIKCIYNDSGELVADPYTIPFSLPSGKTWPFNELTTPGPPRKPKLLNARYYPLSVLKPDVKGNVLRALYFKKPWQISLCIIKQGHAHMFADADGRDIRDRLQWQYDLYQDLWDKIPLPKVLDYFTTDGTAYLVMEFIKGIHLTSWIENIFCNRSWQYLSSEEKLILLNKLLDIFSIISCLHKRGYIHRDITPDNFLIDKKGRVFLVDLELAWSSQRHRPNPPFRLGTPGHISPEQRMSQIPTVKEDIYGVGGLMVMALTNMHAIKFHLYPPEAMQNIIHFLTGEQLLGVLVAACLQNSPEDRPSLQKIIGTLQHYRDGQFREAVSIDTCPSNSRMPINSEEFIQREISSLANSQLLDPKQRWVSLAQKDDSYIGNEQKGLILSEGWHTGMTGILWLVARARNMGFQTDACMQPYTQSWEYLLKHFFPNVQNKQPGIYNGSAGVAMAMVEGIKAGLLTMNESLETYLRFCFSNKSTSLRLADGLSGQGIALLNTFGNLENQFLQGILKGYVTEILAGQVSDGTWVTKSNNPKYRADIFTGMDFGVAGITWFLLCYFRRYPDYHVEVAAKKSLDWLSNHCIKENGQYSWPVSIRSGIKDVWQYSTGALGIAHTFILAYEIWREPLYKSLAEDTLSGIPAAPSRMDWSLASGLAGLGEVYLDAARVFESNEWKRRSDWIAGLFLSCIPCRENLMVNWLPGYTTTATADLFTGNGGILHFCMRHFRQGKSLHPLSA